MEERPQFSVGYETPSADIGVVVLEGEIDIYSAPQFKEVLVNGIEGGARKVIVDLSQVTFIDSTALGRARERRETRAAAQRQSRHRVHRREHHPHLRDHRPRPHLRHLPVARRGHQGGRTLRVLGRTTTLEGGRRRVTQGVRRGRRRWSTAARTSRRGRSLHSVADDMLKTKTYGVGRICVVDGCGTRLSAYNPSSVCALHGGAWQDDFHRERPQVEPARRDHPPLRFRAVRSRVHDHEPGQEVLQRRLPHEGVPGPGHGGAPHGRHERRPPGQLTATSALASGSPSGEPGEARL